MTREDSPAKHQFVTLRAAPAAPAALAVANTILHKYIHHYITMLADAPFQTAGPQTWPQFRDVFFVFPAIDTRYRHCETMDREIQSFHCPVHSSELFMCWS